MSSALQLDRDERNAWFAAADSATARAAQAENQYQRELAGAVSASPVAQAVYNRWDKKPRRSRLVTMLRGGLT